MATWQYAQLRLRFVVDSRFPPLYDCELAESADGSLKGLLGMRNAPAFRILDAAGAAGWEVVSGGGEQYLLKKPL